MAETVEKRKNVYSGSISYRRLWETLERRGIKKTDLKDKEKFNLSPTLVNRLVYKINTQKCIFILTNNTQRCIIILSKGNRRKPERRKMSEDMSVFKSYLRRLLQDLKDLKEVLKSKDYEKAEKMVDQLIDDTQKGIEDN